MHEYTLLEVKYSKELIARREEMTHGDDAASLTYSFGGVLDVIQPNRLLEMSLNPALRLAVGR